MTLGASEGGARSRVTAWGKEIPFRNPNFTGRIAEIEELRRGLARESAAVIDQPPQALFGLGGVGKTEIAAEYAHRHRGDYDLVWWIRSEQESAVVNGLVALGRRMQPPGFRAEERDYSAQLVIEALEKGEPYGDWLIIFDNANNAGMISEYIPRGRGHVIITSRDSHWRKALGVAGIEVGEFTPDETVEFLSKRVPALAGRGAEAATLAAELGHLPLAAEHAAAYMNETGTSAAEYLTKLRDNAHELLAREVDIPYPLAVAATWGVSRDAISPEADTLFQVMAFFAPEPIAEELLAQPAKAGDLPGELSRVLGDVGELRQAARQLARFSLAKIDGVLNAVQMHRVVQAVTRSRLMREDPEQAERFRHAVHLLLAGSDPGAPGLDESDPLYERSRSHIVPSGAVESADATVRQLIINQVRRLHRRGGFFESLSFGELALDEWKLRFGENDRHTLALAIEVGKATRLSGHWERAYALNLDTLERLRTFGEDDQTYLACALSHGVDLCMMGRYQQALDNDLDLLPRYERVFRPEHEFTLQVRNNIAISLRCLGRFEEALEHDRIALTMRENMFGPQEDQTLTSRFAVARDLRRMGNYEQGLDMIRDVDQLLVRMNAPWDALRVFTALDLAIALRRVGYHQQAAAQAEETLTTQIASKGPDHRMTLLVSTNVINDRRLIDDLAGAQALGEQTVAGWVKAAGEDHPNTLSARANLAVVMRVRGNPRAARELNEQALEGFRRHFGDDHTSTLVVMHNLASDLAMMGAVRQARELGEAAYEGHRRVRGGFHPCTLATGANLSVDRLADGDEEGAARLREEILAAYAETLSNEHPEARLAAQQGRINLDVEPMMS
ncbi:FxSxx-COOH system tetratricopeptide repeat protein [Nonomuraea sp. NPDC050394]|uniref:FxSxx-COOH system tetratricopeptide repeat protein n=1 Tax=Nonomuraea sp. NPDC050394 TaxID=3364363 RepID=UPI003787B10A